MHALVPPLMSEESQEAHTAFVLERITQVREEALAGHRRHREDLTDLQTQVSQLTEQYGQLCRKLERLEVRPMDLSTAVLSTRAAAAVVICCIGVASGMWVIDSHVSALGTQIANESDRRKEQFDDVRKEIKLYELKADEIEKKLIAKGVIR